MTRAKMVSQFVTWVKTILPGQIEEGKEKPGHSISIFPEYK